MSEVQEVLAKEVNRLNNVVETLQKEKQNLEIANKLLLGNNKFLAVSLERITEMTKKFDNLHQDSLKTCNQLKEENGKLKAETEEPDSQSVPYVPKWSSTLIKKDLY